MSEIKKAYLQEPRLYYNSYIKELENKNKKLYNFLNELYWDNIFVELFDENIIKDLENLLKECKND